MKTERKDTRVAVYARVSTLNNQNPEVQLRGLREYTSHRGWAITEEYVDQGMSGARETRPALTRLMHDAGRRKFDAVLVWKPDRFGRLLRHLVNALAELEARGVAFVSVFERGLNCRPKLSWVGPDATSSSNEGSTERTCVGSCLDARHSSAPPTMAQVTTVLAESMRKTASEAACPVNNSARRGNLLGHSACKLLILLHRSEDDKSCNPQTRA